MALPPYVVLGEWVDPAPDPVAGPRSHPYGDEAYRIVSTRTGDVRVYPSRDEALSWVLQGDGA